MLPHVRRSYCAKCTHAEPGVSGLGFIMSNRDIGERLLSVYGLQSGATPLYIAADNGRTEVVEALLKSGAAVDYPEEVLFVLCSGKAARF